MRPDDGPRHGFSTKPPHRTVLGYGEVIKSSTELDKFIISYTFSYITVAHFFFFLYYIILFYLGANYIIKSSMITKLISKTVYEVSKKFNT